MELRLPWRQGSPLGQRGPQSGSAPHDLVTLTRSGTPPRPPRSLALLVEQAELPPKGIIRFPLWASYLVPTTWSDVDHLYDTGGLFHIVFKEPIRRVSTYKTVELAYGVFAVFCYVRSKGSDSLEYAVAPTKKDALQKLKHDVRERYGS